jgi:hypothetical protein
VLSALPPGSNMSNLLLELGQGMAAALGVLVRDTLVLSRTLRALFEA